MTRFTFLFLFLSLIASGQKDKKGNVFANAADDAKIFSAKQKMLGGQYLSALNAFREVEKDNPNNAAIKYYIGQCYFSLGQTQNARLSLLKALESSTANIKPETHFLLGRIYQSEDNVEQAIQEFKLYKTAPSDDKETQEDTDMYLSQCENAKKMLGDPVPVTITNLGAEINSKYDDKNPCVTADGKRIVFTTRRPETTNDPTDIEGDGKYFENIYTATIDSSTGYFGKAGGVSSINTKAHDAVTSISPDGKQIFVYYNDINNADKRGGSVFVSKVMNGKWKAPESLGKPVNSSYWEGGACVSPDGKRYFFSSERKGSIGGSDIWMVEKVNKTDWGKPVNLGSEINTVYDEGGMFLAPDGKTLFFCSNGPNSMGSYDVFKTVYTKGKWSSPVNVGYPINTVGKEGQLTISADARYAYVSSDRKGGFGENDIYKIDLKDYAILEPDGKKKTNNGLSILKGTIREGFEGYGVQDVEVIVKDQQNNEVVASTNTNENGEYFFTMHGGRYSLIIKKKGFTEINDPIELGTSEKETVILEKGYLLKK